MPRRDCAATSKSTGQPCRRAAANDSRFCTAHSHGPDPVLALERARAKQERKTRNKIAHTLGITMGDGDPLRIFDEQIRTAEGDFEYWRARVKGSDGPPTHLDVEQYLLAGDRLATLARAAISANLDERKVRVQEAQLVLAAKVIMAVLTHADLGLSLQQVERARVLAIEQARILEASST